MSIVGLVEENQQGCQNPDGEAGFLVYLQFFLPRMGPCKMPSKYLKKMWNCILRESKIVQFVTVSLVSLIDSFRPKAAVFVSINSMAVVSISGYFNNNILVQI
jgi:uncharacterized membrane protein